MSGLPAFRDSSRWIWLTLGALLFLGVSAGVAYRPAQRWLMVRRARQLAQEAQAAIDQRLLVVSSDKIKAALRFAPGEPAVIRVAAHFLTLNGQDRAFGYWDQLVGSGAATLADRQEMVRLALDLNRVEVAQPALVELLREFPTNQLNQELGLELLAATGGTPTAVAAADQILKQFPASATAVIIKARGQLASTNQEQVKLALDSLEQFATNQSAVRLQTLRILTETSQLTLTQRKPWAEMLVGDQGALISDRLLGCDVLWDADPESRPEIVRKVQVLLDAEKGEADLVAVAGWFSRHGRNDLADSLLPAAAAKTSEAIFLSRVEILAEAKLWKEAAALVEEVGRQHSQDAVACAKAFLAHRQGRSDEVATQLKSAVESVGPRWRRLDFLAGYARQLGQVAVALEAWNRLLDEPRFAFSAAANILKNLPDHSFAEIERRAVRVLARLQPRDAEIQAQNAYLDLLSGEKIALAAQTFEKLQGVYPDSPNLVFGLAFSKLRQNQPEKALNLLEQQTLDWSQAEPHHRVIYAAILAGNNQFRDARLQVEKVARNQLRPLEQKLAAEMQSVR